MKRALVLGLLLPLVLAGLVPHPAGAQEQPIRIVSEQIENDFPVALYFSIDVESRAAEITRVYLVYKIRGQISQTKDPLEFEPAQRVQATYRWYTEFTTIPPGVPVLYHWEIRDKAGNILTTETQTFYYDDVRFDWQTLENADLAVFWYDGGEEFGQELYDTASISLGKLKERLGAELAFPIRVVAYGSKDDFVSAFPRMNDWIGGRAFPSMGLTVQIIAPWDHAYMVDVIPHEICHLLFHQLTDNAFVTPPAWLNEGLAVYNEWRDNSYYDQLVAEAAAEGRLLPMGFIVGGFPADRERAILAYAQSYSMVTMLLDVYGWEAMAAYLKAFKNASIRFDEEVAFEEAFGLPFSDFLDGWRVSVGAEPLPAATALPTAVPAGVPSPTPTPPPPEGASPDDRSDSPALCLAPAVLLPAILVLWRRRREVA